MDSALGLSAVLTVVLDANALRRDRYFNSHAYRLLLREAREQRIQLVVPEVVYDEVINLLREDVSAQQTKIRQALRELERLGGRPSIDEDELTVDQAVASYKRALDQALLSAHVKTPEYPTTEHREIVARALRRERPFAPDGQDGYRDTLLWESVKALARESEDPVIVISADHKAFSAKPDDEDLHRHLVDEVTALGRPQDHVTRLPDVLAFTELYVASDEPELVEIQHRLIHEGDLRTRLMDEIGMKLMDLAVDQPDTAALPFEIAVPVERAEVTGLTIDDVEAVAAQRLGDEVLATLEAPATLWIDIHVRKSDAPGLPRGFWVTEGELADRSVEASTSADVVVRVEAIYADRELHVEQIDAAALGF
jgi:rRNA-processing protein FCF1